MGERAHTPGPWLRDGRTVYALDERKNANRFSFHVQEGYLHHTRSERIRTPEEELEATAILAQSAPDMFEALIQAREWLRGWASAETQLAVIDAALAKAEGRQSLADANQNQAHKELGNGGG